MTPSTRAGRLLLPRPAVRVVAGGCLLLSGWWVAWHWADFGALRFLAFPALWLGYIVGLDGIVDWRTGTSLLRRSPARWTGMFVASIPAWWLFEVVNRVLGNWEYIGSLSSAPLRFVYASLCFSTVIPAVFTTADALGHALPARWGTRGPAVRGGRRQVGALVAVGLLLAAGVVIRPDVFFPMTWLCVVLVVDPLNLAAGRPSILAHVRRGHWRLPLILAAAALLCGALWETWNFRSSPKWIYHVSLAPFGLAGTVAERKIFEMPLLGYGGYLPFGLEVYALYQFVAGFAARKNRTYLQFDLEPGAMLTES